jgi:hypothetical protein
MSEEARPLGHTHLRFDDTAQSILFRLSSLYRGIRIHLDHGKVTLAVNEGNLPPMLLRGEVGDDPSEVVRGFAREFVRRCAENAADPRYTPEWQSEWGFWADYIGELLEEGEPDHGTDA